MFRKEKAEEEGNTILAAGLGNPGREYRASRHNIGFMLVDVLSARWDIRVGKVQFRSLLGSGKVGATRVLLAKPQTFMNLSGQAVSSLIRFYKIDLSKVLVAHDDLDLPFGTLRIRPGGGPGGQKGVGSIIQQLGTQDFPRLRIGIGRPPGQMDPAEYVLQNFSPSEMDEIPFILGKAAEAAECYIRQGLEMAMNRFNGPQIADE